MIAPLVALVLGQTVGGLSAEAERAVSEGRLPSYERTQREAFRQGRRDPELLARYSWALVWRHRLYMARLWNTGTSRQDAEAVAAAWNTVPWDNSATVLLARTAFHQELWMRFTSPFMGESQPAPPARITWKDRNGQEQHMLVEATEITGPGKKLEREWNEWRKRAWTLEPSHPEVLLSRLAAQLRASDASAKKTVELARAAGADRLFPLTFKLLAWDATKTSAARKELKDYVKATRNDLVTLCAVRGNPDLKKLQTEP